MAGWDSCTVCAGEGGNGPVAQYSSTQWENSPALDGQAAEFWVGGSMPYAAALWWKQLTPNANARNLVYDLYFYIKNPNAAQALEFDVNQALNGQKFIFGTQCDIRGAEQWEVWDSGNVRWVQTGIACPAPAAYVWHHLVWEFQRNSNGQAVFIALTLDGVKNYVNRAFWPIGAPSGSELNVAFQMDGNASMTAYSTWLDKVTLSYW